MLCFIVYDTWAKLPSGLLHGNLQTPGHFTECVKFRHESIQGQHCMITLRSKINETSIASSGRFEWRDLGSLSRENMLNFVHGMCLPASCSNDEVLNYSNNFVSEAGLEAVKAVCRTNDPVAFTLIDYFTM